MVMPALNYYMLHPEAGFERLKDPRGFLIQFSDKFWAWLGDLKPQCRYRPEPDWENILRDRLGVAQPCPVAAEFYELWPKVNAQLSKDGYRVGPQSFFGNNDGDPEFVRAIWCLVRHLRPERVVETGVGHGITTRFILEALERNGSGRLWSVDLIPVDPALARQIGAAVDGVSKDCWTFIKGSSRYVLSRLLAEIGRLDIFIHDSLHSEHNVEFELTVDRAHLRLGSYVVDDIDTNCAFKHDIESSRSGEAMVCQSLPILPDPRRFDKKDLFG